MRIACLQFAPQVGDVNNNLNRADAVLNKCQDLDGLDLLVLPELAFSGYNFQSLTHIAPHLELAGVGVSALWATTTALRLDCNVVVGYPEKVDMSGQWPASPEYYNSAIMVCHDGEIIANYRKSFLYAVDEKWALEGLDGFFEASLPDLGNVAMGICMDIKFEAPWNAFEFAFHVLEVEANLVILTMAWLTRDSPDAFARLPHEPDLETMEYWIQRLEPVIRHESDEEIIVVFCNRCGAEGDALYAGTSAVVGVRNGEIHVYGILGRGANEVLVVDTGREPVAKLVRDSAEVGPTGQPVEPATRHAADTAQPRDASPPLSVGAAVRQRAASRAQQHGRSSSKPPPVSKVSAPMSRGHYGEWDFVTYRASVSSLPSLKSFFGSEARSRYTRSKAPRGISNTQHKAMSGNRKAPPEEIIIFSPPPETTIEEDDLIFSPPPETTIDDSSPLATPAFQMLRENQIYYDNGLDDMLSPPMEKPFGPLGKVRGGTSMSNEDRRLAEVDVVFHAGRRELARMVKDDNAARAKQSGREKKDHLMLLNMIDTFSREDEADVEDDEYSDASESPYDKTSMHEGKGYSHGYDSADTTSDISITTYDEPALRGLNPLSPPLRSLRHKASQSRMPTPLRESHSLPHHVEEVTKPSQAKASAAALHHDLGSMTLADREAASARHGRPLERYPSRGHQPPEKTQWIDVALGTGNYSEMAPRQKETAEYVRQPYASHSALRVLSQGPDPNDEIIATFSLLQGNRHAQSSATHTSGATSQLSSHGGLGGAVAHHQPPQAKPPTYSRRQARRAERALPISFAPPLASVVPDEPLAETGWPSDLYGYANNYVLPERQERQERQDRQAWLPRGADYGSSRQTPKFNPPTPTAMNFKSGKPRPALA